jgi:hypothetical protein
MELSPPGAKCKRVDGRAVRILPELGLLPSAKQFEEVSFPVTSPPNAGASPPRRSPMEELPPGVRLTRGVDVSLIAGFKGVAASSSASGLQLIFSCSSVPNVMVE